MEKTVKKPKQAETPERELRHEYDFDEGGPLSDEYFEAVTPEHVKKAIADRLKNAPPKKK